MAISNKFYGAKWNTSPFIAYLVGILIGFIAGAFMAFIVIPSTDFIALSNSLSHVKPPQIRAGENNVHIGNDFVTINYKNIYTTGFGNTGSMRPLIDSDTTGVWTYVFNISDIKSGDIIHYYNDTITKNLTIAHRVIFVSNNTKDWFIKTKGDANIIEDSYVVRKEQIIGVLIGIIY